MENGCFMSSIIIIVLDIVGMLGEHEHYKTVVYDSDSHEPNLCSCLL